MSQPNGLLILGDHLFLNYKKKIGQRGLINTAGIINPNLALVDLPNLKMVIFHIYLSKMVIFHIYLSKVVICHIYQT